MNPTINPTLGPTISPTASPTASLDTSPNTSPTFEHLRRMLLRDYPLDPGVITPEAALDSLAIDSLGVAELLFNIEDEFQISVPAEPVQLASVGDVARFIDGLIAAQQAPAAPAGAATPHAVSGR